MNNNLPEIRKESIFYKIREWFKKIFNKEEIVEQQTEKTDKIDNTDKMNKSTFIESIKVESKDVILALQRKLENEEIQIENLTDNELIEMIKLYIKQIKEKYLRKTNE